MEQIYRANAGDTVAPFEEWIVEEDYFIKHIFSRTFKNSFKRDGTRKVMNHHHFIDVEIKWPKKDAFEIDLDEKKIKSLNAYLLFYFLDFKRWNWGQSLTVEMWYRDTDKDFVYSENSIKAINAMFQRISKEWDVPWHVEVKDSYHCGRGGKKIERIELKFHFHDRDKLVQRAHMQWEKEERNRNKSSDWKRAEELLGCEFDRCE